MSENLLELAAQGSLTLVKRLLRTLDAFDCAEQLKTDARAFQVKSRLVSLRTGFNCNLKRVVHHWRLQGKLKGVNCNLHRLKVLASSLLREKKANEGQHSRVPKIEMKSVKASLTDMTEAGCHGKSGTKIPMPREHSESELKPLRDRLSARAPMQEIDRQQIRTPCKSFEVDSRDSQVIPRRSDKIQEKENQQPRGRESTRSARQTMESGGRGMSVPARRDESLFSRVKAELTAKAKCTAKAEVCSLGTRLFNQAQEMESKREQLRKSYEPVFSFTPSLSSNTEKWLSHKANKDCRPPQPCEEVAIVSSVAIMSLNKLPLGLCSPCQALPIPDFTSFCPSEKQRPGESSGVSGTKSTVKTSSLDLTRDSCKENSSCMDDQEQSSLDITMYG
jgi:hypothetical protein